jgi:lambda family phage tail tape measure protein
MSFSDMIDSMIDDLMRMFIQQQIMGPMFKSIGGFDFGSLWPFAKGNAFQNGNVIPFAKGGIVTRPTVFPMAQGAGLMGEAGAEAIMPLTRIGGDLGVKSTGGGAVVNIYNNVGADVSTSERTTADGQKAIDVYIDQAVARKLGTFGSQSNKAMRQSFGARQQLTGR